MKKISQKFIAVSLTLAMTASMGTAALAADFKDMPSNTHWAHVALQAAVDNGLLKGADGLLNPTGHLKRSELATIVNRAFGAAQTADLSAFTDVPQENWYYIEMAKAVKMKTFQGSGTTLNPENDITRQEAFAVLARALQLPTGDVTVLEKFTDGTQVSDSLKAEFAAMVTAGYVKGSEGNINPKGTITREEFAQVMYNIIKTYVDTTEPTTELADGSVMVNVPDATLKGVTVKGDLIIGDGVGAGDFTMDGVTVEGRLLVRGGGENSIKITNGSSVANIVVNKTSDGGVRIAPDASSTVTNVSVAGGRDAVVVDGKVDTLNVDGDAAIEIRGTVNNVQVKANAGNAKVDVAKSATVGTMTVASAATISVSGSVTTVDVQVAATGAKVQVAKDGKIDTVSSAAADVQVSGEGKITTATISGNNTKFDVADTKVTVSENTSGTTVGGKPAEGGSEVVAPPTPDSGSSGGGGGGGGGGSTTTTYKAEIDALIADNKDWIVTGLNTLAPKAEITATISGDTIAVSYVGSAFTNVGTAKDLAEKFTDANASKLAALLSSTIPYVQSITIMDETLEVSDSMTLSQIKTFIEKLFDNKGWDSSTSTGTLPTTENVTVVDNYSNTYTYVLTRTVI